MDLFDFHFHAFIKPLATGYPANNNFRESRNPWRFDKPRISSVEVRLLPKSSFEKLDKFNGTLHISALLSVDYPMICSKTFDMADLMGATHTTTLLSMRVNEPVQNLNTELFVKDVGSLNIPELRERVNYIKDRSDIHPAKINVLFSIEGLHSLYKLKTPGKARRDKRGYFQDFSDFELDYNFFRAIKQSAFGRVLYITVTHLAYWPVCTHAFGLHPFVRQEDNYITDNIRPRGFGYQDIATFSALLDRCFSESYTDPQTNQLIEGKKILFDVKHSGLVSRLQLYALRKKWIAENGKEEADYPIFASHMGVTGISYKKIKSIMLGEDQLDPGSEDCRVVAYDRLKVNSKYGLPFNPSSINLYDEDIREIIGGGGYIGVSADKRILGGDTALRRFWKFGKAHWKDEWTFRRIKEFEIVSTEELKCIYAAESQDLDWLALADEQQRAAFHLEEQRNGIHREGVEADQGDDGDDQDHVHQLTTDEIRQITKARPVRFRNSELDKAMTYNSRTNEALKREIINQVTRGEVSPLRAALTVHLEDDTDINPQRLREMEEMYGIEFEGLEYFVNNVVHIIQTAGEKAWEHICFGSDYDGFIDPIDALLTVDKLRCPQFRFKLELLLAAWTKKEDIFLNDYLDLRRKVSQLLVGNGVKMVQQLA